jgi:hypothetical protein
MNTFEFKERWLHFFKRRNEYFLHSPFMFSLYLETIKPIKWHRKRALQIASQIQRKLPPENVTIISKPYVTPKSKASMLANIKERKGVVIDLFDVVVIVKDKRLTPQTYYF